MGRFTLQCQNANRTKSRLFLQYWHTPILISILTFTYSDSYGGNSPAGNALQIQRTWFNLLSYLLANSLSNVFSTPFGIFSPYWLTMNLLCRNAWCHMFLMIYFLYFFILAPSWCCALFCLAFLVHRLCGSCTGGMFHFLCCVNDIVINFVGNG